MSRPAGVEADALADKRYARVIGLAPGHVDQPRRGGGGAADGMDQRKILFQQFVADHGGDRRGVARGELARRLFELRRPHVIGRRVDEIARQCHAFDDMLKLLAGDALRQIELDRSRLGLAIARETIGAEREGERGEPRVGRLVGETVGAVRQMLWQPAGQKRIPDAVVGTVRGIVRVLDAEQNAAERTASAAFTRQQKIAPRFGFKAGGFHERACLGADRALHVGVVRAGDEPDRNGLGRPACNEDGVHRSSLRESHALLPRRRKGVKQQPEFTAERTICRSCRASRIAECASLNASAGRDGPGCARRAGACLCRPP